MPSEDGVYAARHGDGKTAGSSAAHVRLGADGLEIDLDAGEHLEWPYAGLQSAVPISPRARDVLLRRVRAQNETAVQDEGATLFVGEPAFADALVQRAPHLSGHDEIRRFAIPGLVAVALLVLAAVAAWASGMSPVRTVAGLVPDRIWQAVGDQAFESLTSGHRTCTGADARTALDRLMAKLSKAADTQARFDARIVDWNLINAFALPGRRITVTRQLIATVGNGDELASVIAHEMGHGLEQHPETSITRGLGLVAATKLLLGGGVETIGNIGLLLLQLRYTREAEREADARAVTILRSAKIPARALSSFFERLKKREGRAGEATPQILSTHPSLDERVKALEGIAAYPTEPAMPPADFEALRRACTG